MTTNEVQKKNQYLIIIWKKLTQKENYLYTHTQTHTHKYRNIIITNKKYNQYLKKNKTDFASINTKYSHKGKFLSVCQLYT